MPPGTPDQAVSQVARNLRGTNRNDGRSVCVSMFRTDSAPPPNVAPCVASPMPAISSPRNAAKGSGYRRRSALRGEGAPLSEAVITRANSPPSRPLASVTPIPGPSIDRLMGGTTIVPRKCWLPKNVMPTRPASTITTMMRLLFLGGSLRPSSSSANTTPASGALNVAASPAAPPATSRACTPSSESLRSQRRACSITPAATWTEGPSRPIDSPPKSPAADSRILATDSRSDTKLVRCDGVRSGSSATITCGMPEPPARGNHRRVHQATATVHRGVHTSRARGQAA